MTNTLNGQLEEEALYRNAGRQLAPLFTWRGRDVYPVFGAEEDGGDGTGDGSADTDDIDPDAEDEATKTGSETVSLEDFKKLEARMKAADKRAAELEKFKQQAEDKNKSALELAEKTVAEHEKTISKQNAELAKMRLDNAFLGAETGITWHDPGDALALAERKGYLDGVVDEDGKVDNKKLAAKLKEMAKASPHLVKKGDGTADGSSDAGKDKGSASPTGTPVGSKGGAGKKADGPDLSRYSRFLNR